MRLIRLLKNDLARETGEWVDDGLISVDQAQSICRRYGVEYGAAEQQRLAYRLLQGLGYFFAGLALITLLSANWDEIPRWIRLCGLIGVTAAVQLLALQKYCSGHLAGAKTLFLLGNMIYGAAIILIAQVYHLGEHMPDGIFWWALGSLPVALLLQSRVLMLLSLLLAGVWFATEVSLGFYPALYPLFILSAVWLLMRVNTSLLLFLLTVLSVVFWVEFTLAYLWREGRQFEFHVEHLAVSAALFIFAYAFAQWLLLRPAVSAGDYGAFLKVWCLRFALILLLVMSFEDPWRELIEASWQHWQALMVVLTPLLSLSMLLAYRAGRLWALLAIIAVYVLAFVWVGLSQNPEHAPVLQVLDNILLLAAGVGLIVRGVQAGISHYYYLGILTVLVTALVRYIDLIGDYVGASLLFTLFAFLLLGAARCWKRGQLGQGGL